MKKIFVLLLIAFCFYNTACLAAEDNAKVTVYITKTGSKYHRFDCPTLRNTKIPISLGDAVLEGLEPCSVCNPPTLSAEQIAAIKKANKEANSGNVASEIYRVNIAGLKKSSQGDTSKMLKATVIRHIDGDTVELEFKNPIPPINKTEKIRMIGVDTPETVHPKKQVEFFGKEASDFTKKALLGKDIFVALDWDTRDKYGRLLAYIYLQDGECFNAKLLKEGMAHCYTRFPFQFLDEFRQYEAAARAQKRGLWG